MRANSDGISVFVPGHHLATGVKNGASGAYSNVACLNPTAAQKWYDMICSDMESAFKAAQQNSEREKVLFIAGVYPNGQVAYYAVNLAE